MSTSDLEGRNAKCHIFLADLRNYAYTVKPRTATIGKITHLGRGVFLGGQPRPIQMGGPQRPKFL